MNKHLKTIVLLTTLTGSGTWGGNAYAAACSSIATGNWSAATTWAAPCNIAGGPTAADTVTIANLAHTVTVDVNSASASLTFATGNKTAALLLNPAVTMRVTGAVTLNAPTGAATKSINVGAGTLNAASILIAGGAVAGNAASVTVSTGTITTTGSITFAGTASDAMLISTGASTINIGGDLGNGGTLTTGGTGTINFNGTVAAQNIGAYLTYNNITIANTNVAGFVNLLGATSMTGALTVTSGTLFTGGFPLAVAGNLTVNGAITGNGTVTLSGAGTAIDGTGLVSTNTGILTISAAKSILPTANLAIASPIAITAAVSVTNNGTITSTSVSGITDVAGSAWVNAAGSTLNVAGPLLASGTLTANAAGNTVNYTGSAQTVKPTAYHHLSLSGSGAVSMAGVTSIGGNLSVSGTATMTANAAFTVGGALNYSSTGPTTLTAATPVSIGSFNLSAGTLVDNGNTITVTGTGIGTWIQSAGTYIPTGTVVFTGAAPQIGAANFNNLTFGTGIGNSATLTGNVTASGILNLTSGLVITGANILELSASCATAISGGSATGYVLGNLRLHYPTLNPGTTTCTYPVGDATAYTPAVIAMANVSSTLANSSLTTRTDAGDHANTTVGASGIVATRSVNRYWTLTPGVSLAYATYDTTFTFAAGDIDTGATAANFIIGRKNGASWSYPVMGARNPTDTSATGMIQADGFGEFVIGERMMPSITVLKTVAVHSDPVNLLTNPKYIPGALAQYAFFANNSGGPADNGSTFIADPVPVNTSLYVNDIGGAGSGPVIFTQGAASSTLTYAFTTLNDMADDVSFSNDGGATWTAVPVADAFGCDATITHIRINPKGTFVGSAVAPNPGFQLTFRVCVQ